MNIREYIEENSYIGDAVIVYYESGYSDIDINLDLEIDEKDDGEFETSEDYDAYYEEIETQKELADKLIEEAEGAYQCDDDGFEDMVNEVYIDPALSGAADAERIYRYFDYDKFRDDLLVGDYYYEGGYYFLIN